RRGNGVPLRAKSVPAVNEGRRLGGLFKESPQSPNRRCRRSPLGGEEPVERSLQTRALVAVRQGQLVGSRQTLHLGGRLAQRTALVAAAAAGAAAVRALE